MLDLYRRTPGRLEGPALADTLRLADLAAVALVHHSGAAAADGAGGWTLDADFRPEIDQASGMLSVLLGVDIAAAYARLRGHAFATGLPLAEAAAALTEMSAGHPIRIVSPHLWKPSRTRRLDRWQPENPSWPGP